MATIHFLLACALLAAKSVVADSCSYIEALGYVNVTRPLNLAYIEEQTQYW